MISAILREFERQRLRAFCRGWFAIPSAAVGPLEVGGEGGVQASTAPSAGLQIKSGCWAR